VVTARERDVTPVVRVAGRTSGQERVPAAVNDDAAGRPAAVTSADIRNGPAAAAIARST
jgi:hypothetical protein